MAESQAIFTETQLETDLWQIHEDGAGQSVDCYLAIGTEKAALIDSLMSRGNRRLYDMVREKTGLPIVILHTHGHGDHVGAELQEFIEAGCEAYVSPLDFPILGSFGAAYPTEVFHPLCEGQIFDLGGTVLECVEIPGHTPGSVVFLDKAHQRLFSGDSIGSGHFWMQLDHSQPLTTLLQGVEKLREKTAALPNLLIYPGHRSQSPVQLTSAYLCDLHELLKAIIAGNTTGGPIDAPLSDRFKDTLEASRGMVLSMLYNKNRIRA